MTELKKVVKELARIREDHFGGMTSYEGEVLDAAIALLKAQEPVKPVWMGEEMRIGFYACGACGMNMGTNPNYCWHCGKKVKWE